MNGKSKVNLYSLGATFAFLAALWLFDYVDQPGTQWLGALALGIVANVMVGLIMRGAREIANERRSEVPSWLTKQ